jgi:hypothetical protein
MTVFIQNNSTGAGAGTLAPNQAIVDLGTIANGDTGFGVGAQVGNRQQVTYAPTLPGIPPARLNTLVNTAFNPNYGAGAQAVNIIVLPVLSNFMLNDGRSILTVGGTALPPSNSGLPGAVLNNTTECLVIYDTTQNNGAGYCTARAGTGGTLDLQTPNPVILYHELSHAFRTVNANTLALTAACNPSSPEENAAIVDENDMRNQLAAAAGTTAVLRDPGIHCGGLCPGGSTTGSGGCCIIASVASGSSLSSEVASLRSIRDRFLRTSEIGFAFFESLHRDYYGFSPQVCTLMAQYPVLRNLILEGFVRPLVIVLEIMADYVLDGGSEMRAAEKFVSHHLDRSAAVERLAILSRARQVLNGDSVELTAEQQQLAALLVPALESRHVKWALIEPLEIYSSALHSFLREAPAPELGLQLVEAIGLWSQRMPLDDVWAVLAVHELRAELALLDHSILRTEAARSEFRNRLRHKFYNVTAVATGVGDQN